VCFVVILYNATHTFTQQVNTHMPFISRVDAESILGPYFSDIQSIVHSAWSDWRKANIAPHMQHKRVRANYVWNQLITHAKRQFVNHHEVKVETFKKWDGMLVRNNIFIRMKKGSQNLYSCNYPTQTALAFHDQNQDMFGGVTRLELIYVLNKAETDIERIALVQRHRTSVVWIIDLINTAAVAPNVIQMQLNNHTTDQNSVADRIIKPKLGDVENDQNEPKFGSGE